MTRSKAEASPAIGIDLGTWKCCVGVVRDGKVEIIENERGSKTTPSYVAFTETERLVGEDARIQASVNATNTVFGVKRMIGRTFDDPSLKDLKDTLPFKVKEEDGKPHIQVAYKGNSTYLCPEQVSAMLLTKMKSIAESHLGCKVKDAVISVPASFNNCQRQATKDAGAIAGLNVLGLINEPTAAALAYRDNKGSMDETIMVVDMGGGTLDVSVIKLKGDGLVEVKKTCGNTSFGGIDFDVSLSKHFQLELTMKTRQDIEGNKKAAVRLHLACEKLKHTLTLLRAADIHLECLADDTDLTSSLTKDKFNHITASLLEHKLCTVLSSLSDDPEPQLQAVSRILLVGGSTRVPLVQNNLKSFFNGKKLDLSVNPDEAIAHGAAIYASELSLGYCSVLEVCPHAVSLTTEGDYELPLLAANSPIARREYVPLDKPEMSKQTLFLTEEQVLVGDGNVNKTDLGAVKLTDRDGTVYGLACGFDRDGLFVAELMKKSNEKVLYERESLERMRKEEEQFAKDDREEKERLKALNCLEDYCSKYKAKARQMRNEPRLQEPCEAFMRDCDIAMSWIEDNPGATKEECKERLMKLYMKITILTELLSKENFPADYLRYEGHPYLMEEASSSEESDDRKLNRKSKKGKNKFYSAPTQKVKRRPSLATVAKDDSKATDSDLEDAAPQPGRKTKRASSERHKQSKFFSARTSKQKKRSSVQGRFISYDSDDGSSKQNTNSIREARLESQNYPGHKKKKNACSLM